MRGLRAVTTECASRVRCAPPVGCRKAHYEKEPVLSIVMTESNEVRRGGCKLIASCVLPLPSVAFIGVGLRGVAACSLVSTLTPLHSRVALFEAMVAKICLTREDLVVRKRFQ